jgi:hypothetical protein
MQTAKSVEQMSKVAEDLEEQVSRRVVVDRQQTISYYTRLN